LVVQVAKWGNSLAVRLPASLVRELSIKEGDEVELHRLDDGKIAIITARQRREAAARRLAELAVAFPADYKFDRDEVNAR
jgi:antitoxin MazE